MDDVRWSDSQLRSYINTEAAEVWSGESSDRAPVRNRFRAELRAVLVPVVQARLLETIGVLTDPEGLTMVCYDLIEELRYEEKPRRWVLSCTQPWDFLAEWITEEVGKAYKATAGKKRPSDKVLQEIERANQ